MANLPALPLFKAIIHSVLFFFHLANQSELLHQLDCCVEEELILEHLHKVQLVFVQLSQSQIFGCHADVHIGVCADPCRHGWKAILLSSKALNTTVITENKESMVLALTVSSL